MSEEAWVAIIITAPFVILLLMCLYLIGRKEKPYQEPRSSSAQWSPTAERFTQAEKAYGQSLAGYPNGPFQKK